MDLLGLLYIVSSIIIASRFRITTFNSII